MRHGFGCVWRQLILRNKLEKGGRGGTRTVVVPLSPHLSKAALTGWGWLWKQVAPVSGGKQTNGFEGPLPNCSSISLGIMSPRWGRPLLLNGRERGTEGVERQASLHGGAWSWRARTKPVEEDPRPPFRAPLPYIPSKLTPASFPTGARLEGRQGVALTWGEFSLAPQGTGDEDEEEGDGCHGDLHPPGGGDLHPPGGEQPQGESWPGRDFGGSWAEEVLRNDHQGKIFF